MENDLRSMIEDIIEDVDKWRNRCAERYFNTIRAHGIEEEDAVFELFDDLMDGYDDVEEAVKILSPSDTHS